jgi:hypothetical protein
MARGKFTGVALVDNNENTRRYPNTSISDRVQRMACDRPTTATVQKQSAPQSIREAHFDVSHFHNKAIADKSQEQSAQPSVQKVAVPQRRGRRLRLGGIRS